MKRSHCVSRAAIPTPRKKSSTTTVKLGNHKKRYSAKRKSYPLKQKTEERQPIIHLWKDPKKNVKRPKKRNPRIRINTDEDSKKGPKKKNNECVTTIKKPRRRITTSA